MDHPGHNSTAVLLLAHGTPNTLGEMPEYLSKVTGGRALPPSVVAELQHRYAQIGLGDTPGTEPPPLTRWTLAQARLLEIALQQSGHALPVYVAMRNWHPFIPVVVHQMLADGVTHILALCLAPQNSSTSTGLYRRALTSALEAEAAQNPSAAKPSLTFIESWSDEPALIEAFAQRLIDLYPRACAQSSAQSLPVLFTAHSVPCRTIQPNEAGKPSESTSLLSSRSAAEGSASSPNPYPIEANPLLSSRSAAEGSASSPNPYPIEANPLLSSRSAAGVPGELARWGGAAEGSAFSPDPYPIEAKHTAELVFASAARRLPNLKKWFFAFQSQGIAGGPWIGPTVEDTLAAIRAEGHPAVVLQPIGFLSDHVEILYDIDIAFAATARSLGLRLYRTESLNDSPLLTQALLHVVLGSL
jgi:ferrochelatase